MRFSRSIRFLASLCLICPLASGPFTFNLQTAVAAECASRACISVFIEDGQIVIEGRKGSTPKPRARREVPPKVRATPVPTPLPFIGPTALAKPRLITPKRTVRKFVRKVAPVISLNDRLVKLLPTGNISREPQHNAIVNVPVIYWCDLPTIFSTKVAIVGEVVDVTMRPAFLWSFGDGTFFATTEPGSAYPNQSITHTYTHAGTFVVMMVATWGGTWSHEGVTRAIAGKIRKVAFKTVQVANGQTLITQ